MTRQPANNRRDRRGEKRLTVFNPIGIGAGIAIGAGIGVAMGNVAVGVGIGFGIGMALSVLLGRPWKRE